jgi:hypothetical protein
LEVRFFAPSLARLKRLELACQVGFQGQLSLIARHQAPMWTGVLPNPEAWTVVSVLNLSQGLPLMSYLFNTVKPAKAKFQSPRTIYKFIQMK